eukprot:816070-Pyramimonas_sp.AAC.1
MAVRSPTPEALAAFVNPPALRPWYPKSKARRETRRNKTLQLGRERNRGLRRTYGVRKESAGESNPLESGEIA